MATERDDGGPAFPRSFFAAAYSDGKKEMNLTVPNPEDHPQGMSLRDWFAGKALEGLLAADSTPHFSERMAAGLAYGQADAMLVARNGGGGR